MRSHGRNGWTPHQYHARHPYQCFVCQGALDKGSTYTHEETGARTCSPLRFTTYERWWLRKKPHVDPPAPSPLDIAPWSLTNWPNSSVPYASQPDNRNSSPQLQMRSNGMGHCFASSSLGRSCSLRSRTHWVRSMSAMARSSSARAALSAAAWIFGWLRMPSLLVPSA